MTLQAAIEPENTTRVRREDAIDILQKIESHDPHHPIHWSLLKKWLIVTVYCLLQVFISMTSTSYTSIAYLIQTDLGGSTQVVTLGQSLWIAGNAVGPVILGPLSDIGGRKWVYVGATLLYAIFNIGSAKALNLPMLFIFQFLCGATGSVALCNVAGTVADLFGSMDGAALPMALFVATSAYGPSIGAPVGEALAENENLSWSWLFWINVIIGVGFAACLAFVPETLPHVVISRAEREISNNDNHAHGTSRLKPIKEFRFVVTMALRILFTEPMITALGIYNGYNYGLFFLFLTGLYPVYTVNNGLTPFQTSLTYLNVLPGVTFIFLYAPIQTYFFKRDRIRHGMARPEARFLVLLYVIWLFPASLFWFAFTSSGNVSFWCPLVAGAVATFVDPLLYLCLLNYITDAYPNVAGSAIAAFLVPSFLGAAAFAHIGIIMFANLSTQWAFAILAFTSLPLVGLIYIVYFFGPKLRASSKLARKF